MTEQEKMNKVIKGLKYLHDVKCWSPDESEENITARRNITGDALALLKAQEPKPVDEWPDEFLCPTCKTRLAGRSHDDCILLETNDTPNYCWVCGQAVKWE